MTQVFERQSETSNGAVDSSKPQPSALTIEERQELIALVEKIRIHQLPNGAVKPEGLSEATNALTDVVARLRHLTTVMPSLTVCLADMDDWLEVGLDTTPRMNHLIKHGLTLGAEGAEDIMLTVTTTLNYSDGYSLEFVLFRRFDGPPAAALRQVYHCNFLVIANLIDATAGFGMESNCIVTFTECLAGGTGARDVMDVFFTSKNALRGKVLLQPILENILAPDIFSELRAATLDELRLIVPCKTVTHEWSHRQGVMPLTEFRVLTYNPVGGGLEEARVELNGAHILYTLAEQGGPFAAIYNMAAQFIIADRLFRYPYSAHPSDNADAVSGQYFLGQFIAKGLLTCNAGGVHLAGRNQMIRGLAEIIKEITEIHYFSLTAGIPQARQAVQDHVARYSPALDENGTMQRSIFYEWMVARLQDVVPPTMDWKAAIAEHGE